MTPADTIQLDLQSEPRELRGVREKIQSWAPAWGWSEAQVGEIIIAVDEALTNVIEHGYEGSTGKPIHLTLRNVPESEDPRGGLEVRIRDFGKQVDPSCIRSRDLDDVRDGGLGVFLIQTMMSHAEYGPAEGGGMLLVLRKYRDHTVASRPCPTEPT